MEQDGYQLLDPRSKKAMYIKNAIAVIVLAVADAVLFAFGGRAGIEPAVIWCVTAAVIALILMLLVWPQIFYRHYRYIVDGEKVDVRRGVLFITRTVVPIERVHQVEVTRGPISNALGLADVTVTTAGGSAKIEYLEQDVADSIAEHLREVVNGIVRDRESE